MIYQMLPLPITSKLDSNTSRNLIKAKDVYWGLLKQLFVFL